MENEIKRGSNQTEFAVSFYLVDNNRLAISELTYMDSEIAKGYLSIAEESNPEAYQLGVELLEKSKGCLFLNRLNVPKELRNKGYGKELLKETIDFCMENNILLINTASNYGEMGQENLIKFYQNAGMKLLEEEGLLIYHKDLEIKKTNKLRI